MRILLVEDNEKLAKGIADVLSGSGFQVDVVGDGEEAEAALLVQTFALVILDLNLPGLDGLDVLKNLRGRGVTVPVLVVTARGDLDDRVLGLDIGADDYLTKPFEVSELEARVRALIRRSAGKAQSAIDFSGLVLDIASNTLTADGAPVEISPRELSVFRLMLMSRGRVVPKAQIVDALSTFDADISENAVEQTISRLRKRLAAHGIGIRTARGMGYFLFSEAERTT